MIAITTAAVSTSATPYEDLIARIYEAAALPELWPDLLEALAGHLGARGGLIGRLTPNDAKMLISPGIEDMIAGWIARGYHLDARRSLRLIETAYPGFMTDIDLFTPAERKTLPFYADYLTPLAMHIGAGTFIPGASDHGLTLTLEGFADEHTVRTALPRLDALRPHLARAAVLSGELQMRETRIAVDALEQAGAAAAIVGHRGQLIAANAAFLRHMESWAYESRARLHMAHRASDAAYVQAIGPLARERRGTTIAIRDHAGTGVAALHMIPVKRRAHEVFADASAIAIIAQPNSRIPPETFLIQSLFDLTPAEALVARHIAAGESIEAFAVRNGKSVETIRSHLKRVYSKTNTSRQNELAHLLLGFGTNHNSYQPLKR